MKTCPKCNKEAKDTAKFCGGCGYKFPDEQAAVVGAICPKCGDVLKPGAKFCGKCGTKLDAAPAAPADTKGMELLGNSGFVRWTILPGQIAVKITESEVEACGKIKGISIQEGTKALVFVNGRIGAELPAGNYKLKELATEEKSVFPESTGIMGVLLRAGGTIASTIQNIARLVTGENPTLSIVLVRSVDFPLVFNFREANTSGIRSDVGLHILCKVANINAFYQSLLPDRGFVSYESLQKSLETVVGNQVNLSVSALTPDRVGNNPQLVAMLQTRLQEVVRGVYPFIAVSKILQVTADNQAIAGLQRMGEELYVSEQELAHLQKRNNFLNRLQATKNEQELAEIRAANGQEVNKGHIEADFKAKKLDIYKQMALTQDEQDQFDLMLDAERQLREAKTQEQIDVAMLVYEKSGLLREQEIDRLRHQGRMADLRDMQEYDMFELRGEIAMKRVQDEYSDERREKNANFEESRRLFEIQLDRKEQQNQLDMLHQAQAIRMERENAEHQRKLEAENAARAHEEAMQKQQLDAKLENQRIYAGMTVEQIMAANPDISPEAAKALAQKFAADSKDELLKAREADMARQSAQQTEMMRMMQQMAMAGMGVNQQHQQEMMATKQEELDRTRIDASRSEDRLLAGVQSAVSAAGVAFSGKAQGMDNRPVRNESETPSIPAATKSDASAAAKCPVCGANLEPGSSFCGECGNAV